MRVDDPDDHSPFADDWHDCTLAGYRSTIERSDGLTEWGYQSILMFLGLPVDELREWRASLIAALTNKARTKFEASQNAYLAQLERAEQIKLDKKNKKRNKKDAQTFDPLAGNTSGEMKAKKSKTVSKPKTGAKGATRKYANQIAKDNMETLI